jgi:hypothetical protein
MAQDNADIFTDDVTLEIDDDALVADWNGDDAPGKPDDEDEADQPETETQDDTSATGTETTQDDKERPAETTPTTAEPKRYTLKHLDETREVGEEEIVPLAQKGMDYDRQKQKNAELQAANDRLSTYEAFLKELAEAQGFTPDDFIDDVRATALAQTAKIDKPTAAARIKAMKEAKAKPPEAEKAPEKPPEKTPEQFAAERREREVKEFVGEYKTVDPKTIPQEVWDAVKAGKSLLVAYQQHENRQLKAQLEAEKKNAENKAKSTGSRKTAGAATERDEIETLWYAD